MIKTNRWVRFATMAVLIAGLLMAWNLASIGQAPAALPGVAWEYREHFAGNEDHLGPLNKLGSQGWELVTAYSKDPQGATIYVFKRAKK